MEAEPTQKEQNLLDFFFFFGNLVEFENQTTNLGVRAICINV